MATDHEADRAPRRACAVWAAAVVVEVAWALALVVLLCFARLARLARGGEACEVEWQERYDAPELAAQFGPAHVDVRVLRCDGYVRVETRAAADEPGREREVYAWRTVRYFPTATKRDQTEVKGWELDQR